jgi:hypothetical protein
MDAFASVTPLIPAFSPLGEKEKSMANATEVDIHVAAAGRRTDTAALRGINLSLLTSAATERYAGERRCDYG